jgi:hypothetical protein
MRRRDLGETLFSPVQLIIILQLVSMWSITYVLTLAQILLQKATKITLP